MAKGPVFLERRSYRMRRMIDAVRLLPFLGVLLWMLPLGWPNPETAGAAVDQAVPMSTALKYLFGVWALLVLVCWLLWRRTADRISIILPPERDLPD